MCQKQPVPTELLRHPPVVRALGFLLILLNANMVATRLATDQPVVGEQLPVKGSCSENAPLQPWALPNRLTPARLAPLQVSLFHSGQ